MSLDLFGPIATQLGFGGVSGFVVGYATKKMVKVLLILLGLFFITLQYLTYQGFISINYDKVLGMLQSLSTGLISESALPGFLTANIPFLGSFIVGFGLGMIKG